MAAVADDAGVERGACARALHAFCGQAEHELDFSAGVDIVLLRRVDENWLEGKLDGKIGIFPANHVKIEAKSPSGMANMYHSCLSLYYCVFVCWGNCFQLCAARCNGSNMCG